MITGENETAAVPVEVLSVDDEDCRNAALRNRRRAAGFKDVEFAVTPAAGGLTPNFCTFDVDRDLVGVIDDVGDSAAKR